MAIRDRGKQKWQFAFGMPELLKAQRNLWMDQERMKKPIIDEYEKEEFVDNLSTKIMLCRYGEPIRGYIFTNKKAV